MAREFYLNWLGFTTDWEHRFAPGMPLYTQVRLGSLQLHLTGHHGDASPGAKAYVRCTGLRAFCAELNARPYANNTPVIEAPEWGGIEMMLTDPFGNRIVFAEQEAGV